MAQEKAPAYQWYPKDYENDEAVKLMTYEQEGIYRRLLDHQALHGSIPALPAQIARLVPKVPLKRFLSLWDGIAGKFALVGDRLVNAKLERVKAATAAFQAMKSRGGLNSVESRRRTHGTAQPNTSRTELRTEPRAGPEPASASASAFKNATHSLRASTLESDLTSERAGQLVMRYGELYSVHRSGAVHRSRPSLDWSDACSLVKLWPDDRLEKLAILVLTTDDPWISGTDRSFAIFVKKATWADDRLTAWEQSRKASA